MKINNIQGSSSSPSYLYSQNGSEKLSATKGRDVGLLDPLVSWMFRKKVKNIEPTVQVPTNPVVPVPNQVIERDITRSSLDVAREAAISISEDRVPSAQMGEAISLSVEPVPEWPQSVGTSGVVAKVSLSERVIASVRSILNSRLFPTALWRKIYAQASWRTLGCLGLLVVAVSLIAYIYLVRRKERDSKRIDQPLEPCIDSRFQEVPSIKHRAESISSIRVQGPVIEPLDSKVLVKNQSPGLFNRLKNMGLGSDLNRLDRLYKPEFDRLLLDKFSALKWDAVSPFRRDDASQGSLLTSRAESIDLSSEGGSSRVILVNHPGLVGGDRDVSKVRTVVRKSGGLVRRDECLPELRAIIESSLLKEIIYGFKQSWNQLLLIRFHSLMQRGTPSTELSIRSMQSTSDDRVSSSVRESGVVVKHEDRFTHTSSKDLGPFNWSLEEVRDKSIDGSSRGGSPQAILDNSGVPRLGSGEDSREILSGLNIGSIGRFSRGGSLPPVLDNDRSRLESGQALRGVVPGSRAESLDGSSRGESPLGVIDNDASHLGSGQALGRVLAGSGVESIDRSSRGGSPLRVIDKDGVSRTGSGQALGGGVPGLGVESIDRSSMGESPLGIIDNDGSRLGSGQALRRVVPGLKAESLDGSSRGGESFTIWSCL